MIITYYGGTCVRLQSGSVSLLADPDTDRLKGDLIVRTSTSVLSTGALTPTRSDGIHEIVCPGEYEVGGIEVLGFPARGLSSAGQKESETSYVVTWEEMRFGLLGAMGQAVEADALDMLETAHVLFLSVASKGGFSPEQAVKLVRHIEPAFVVPHYDTEKDVLAFAKAMGQKVVPEDKLVFKKKDLIAGKGTIVYLASARS